MESGVEYHHLGSLGEHLGNRMDTKEMGRVVERCEIAADLDLLEDVVVHEAAAVEEIGTLHDAVADCIHIVERLQDSVLGIHQGIHDELHSELVVRDGKGLFEGLLALGFMGDVSFRESDFLDKTLGLDLIIGGALHVK